LALNGPKVSPYTNTCGSYKVHPLHYTESEERLKIRIRAHTEYADFILEDWLSDWLGEAGGKKLLEIGCGNGNFFPVYAKALGKSGLIIGFDINRELLKEARTIGERLDTPAFVFPWDFDVHPFPLLDGEVDILIAPFSAYYTNDAKSWVGDSVRVVKKKGRLLLLGPTEDNARELYELNEMVTGIKSVPETDQTSRKLEEALLPELRERLGDAVKATVMDRHIVFPSAEEFARYYFATWLYEKTRERIANPIEYEAVLRAAEKTSLRLTKKITCIEAHIS